MQSALPLQMIDDDDDFDWDAAVREIDVACLEASKPSSTAAATTSSAASFRNSDFHMGSCPTTGNNRPSSSRQTTLDRYIGMTGSKSANQDAINDAQDRAECDDERVSTVSIDREAANTWIYPENVPVREYQVSITRTALFSNTLVALPTGLGKTLIAAVVIYNYFRWFPEGKIVFAAPSRPLVMQQIEACHNIVGIPQEWTVDMTGQTNPTKRACLWKAKRIFFVTPQVLEKDIQSGSCVVNQLVCLVIDEAHRASGNYAYCVVVRELMAVPVQLRILALTATPGSNHQTVQQVIDNLQISSLEHRSESDPDVTPYVHDRKVEVIQVAMGKDALEANNLLIDVIRPNVAKLAAIGVLPKRDFQTLSPCDFLNSREKFREAPPQDLPQFQYEEVERIFGVLITLYHIRRLLSAHGIRPAFEMIEDKLKQGPFARLLSRNETFWKAKVIMKQNLDHGAFSPKFSKMLEVLIEHFEKQDPKKSRVIIFSNYRDSVRDILKSLETIGTHVKATEFIGQSSGKSSKGQSQKNQQAVLEKFRSGGYNVIVATSIGEEGLDIMEVDLVICFDANVSPLRMIQRMGRTGRKSQGRVVVLACEGLEIKGYMRKQASSKAIQKHMRNGGMNSFRFHSSPRMVPHVFRPEKMLVKLFIEDFVPRGKKVKGNDAIQTPKYKAKLIDVETGLLAKYFHPSIENNWRPSLIAFPHFQAFPSRVHEVAHSLRTRMLVDTMQHLQGLSVSNHDKSFKDEDEETSEECFRVKSDEHLDGNTRGDDATGKEPENDVFSVKDTSRTEEKQNWPHFRTQDPPIHSFLFGSDFMSVDSLGRVLILSVPLFPLKQVSPPISCIPQNTLFLNSTLSKVSHNDHAETALGVHDVSTTLIRTQGNDGLVTSLQYNNDLQEDKVAADDRVVEAEISNLELLNREVNTTEIYNADVDDTHSADELSTDSKAADLSPRLTNLLRSGVVPESPIYNSTSSKVKGSMSPDLDMLPNAPVSLVQSKNDEGAESTPNRRKVAALCFQGDIEPPGFDLLNSPSDRCISASKIEGEIQTPLTNVYDNSCSKDWMITSGEKSVSGPKQRLKRLRKIGDTRKRKLLDKEELVGHKSGSGRGSEKLLNDTRVFIEDEAEASSEASGDEDVDDGQDTYCGSFIDDRINPTVASTHAEYDMMAIYRRSLLSQSPITGTYHSPDNVVSMDQTHDSGTNSSSVPMNTAINGSSRGNESRKRKLSCSPGGSLPICNLEREMFDGGKESSCQVQTDAFDDDDFYAGIDLDALEEEAAKQLRSRSELNEKPNPPILDYLGSPSFDLGI